MLASPMFAVGWALLSGAVLAQPLAVIDPCPQDKVKTDLMTITSQYQPVSTCIPQTIDGTTTYLYNTYEYVSTTIPCAREGDSTSIVLVTDISQWITVTKYPDVTKTIEGAPGSSPTYETAYKQGLAAYYDMGPLAIPGWSGSGLCSDCDKVRVDGSRRQKIHMQECRRRKDWQRCVEYDEFWISKPAQQAASTTYPVCAMRSAVGKAGTYTFTFHQPGCTSTVLASSQTITVTQPPWDVYITKSCGGPTTFDFTTTVTKTITLKAPYGIEPPTATTTILNPPITGFPVPPPSQSGPPYGGPGGSGILTVTLSPSIPGPFVTLTVTPIGPYNGAGPSTVTLATPSGTSPGTVEVIEAPTGAATMTSSFIPGQYVTITVTPIGQPGGSGPTTLTLATPSGTNAGTIEVIAPPMGSGTFNSASMSGQYTTFTVTPVGPGGGAAPTTITLATPSGTSPGVVEVIDSPVGTATGVMSSGTGQYVSLTVTQIGSSTGAPPLTVTLATPSGTSPGTVEVIEPPSSSSPISGSYTTEIMTSGGSGPGASLVTTTIAMPSGTAPGTVVVSNAPSASLTTITGTSTTITASVITTTLAPSGTMSGTVITTVVPVGPASTATPCTDAICLLLSASAGSSGLALSASLTAGTGPGNGATGAPSTGPGGTPCSGILCASVGASLPVGDLSATLGVSLPTGSATTTISAGSGSVSTSCNGAVCVVVSATLPVGGASASVIVLPTSGLLDASAGLTLTTAPAATGAASTSCNGAVCVVVSATVPVGGASASVVVLPTSGLLDASAGLTLTTAPAATGTASTSCNGAVCVVVSATLPVGGAGGSVVVLPSSSLLDVSAGLTLTTAPAASGTASTSCIGTICVIASASLPVGDGGVSVVILPSSALLDASAGLTLTTAPPATGTASTSCNGAVCVVVSASAVLDQLGASAVVLPTSGGIASITVSDIAVASATPAAGAASTPCSGVLCLSASVSVPVVQASVSAVILPSSGVAIVSAGVSPVVVIASTPTPNPSNAAASTPCSGVLCVSASVSVPIVQASVSGVVLPSSGVAIVSAAVVPKILVAGAASSSPIVAVSVSAGIPLAKRTASAAETPTEHQAMGGIIYEIDSNNIDGVADIASNQVVLPMLPPHEPTTLITSAIKAQATAGFDSIAAESCSITLHICSEMDLNILLETQQVPAQYRIGRKITHTLENTLNGCLSNDNCKTYGVTQDGVLSFTSGLSLSMIGARADAYTWIHRDTCDSKLTIQLYKKSADCLAQRLVLESVQKG